MFFRVLAAMVTADAFDRRMREQQRRAWLAHEQLRRSGAATPAVPPGDGSTGQRAAGGASAASNRVT